MRSLGCRLRIASVGVLAGLLFASTASAYSPGTATARKPVYNAYKGGFDYSCAFTGWRSGAKVSWSCKLYLYSPGPWVTGLGLSQSHSGAWTPGPTSYTTPTYFKPLTGSYGYCVVACALSVDGGRTSQACNF